MVSIKQLFEPADMTIGTPWKRIAMFSIPMLIGNIAQQLYNTVDSIVVGHYVGDNALAAVGYLAVAVTQCLSGVMRGAGDTMTPMWISLVTTVALRVPIAYGISWLTRTPELPYGRFECIQISLLISWVLGAVLTVIFYGKGKWRTKAIE